MALPYLYRKRPSRRVSLHAPCTWAEHMHMDTFSSLHCYGSSRNSKQPHVTAATRYARFHTSYGTFRIFFRVLSSSAIEMGCWHSRAHGLSCLQAALSSPHLTLMPAAACALQAAGSRFKVQGQGDFERLHYTSAGTLFSPDFKSFEKRTGNL